MKKERRDKLKIQGSRIKKFREEKGITQKELATICGYAEPTTIFKIEKGLQELPDDRMAALCKALDVSFSDIKGDIVVEYADGHLVVVERNTNLTNKRRLIRQITALLERADDIQLDIIYTFIRGYIKEANDGNTDLEREGRQMDPQSH